MNAAHTRQAIDRLAVLPAAHQPGDPGHRSAERDQHLELWNAAIYEHGAESSQANHARDRAMRAAKTKHKVVAQAVDTAKSIILATTLDFQNDQE